MSIFAFWRLHSKAHALLWVSHCSFPMGIPMEQYFRTALCNLVTTNVCPAGAVKSILMMWGLRAAGDWHPSGKMSKTHPEPCTTTPSMKMMNDQFPSIPNVAYLHATAFSWQEYCERKVQHPYQYQYQCYCNPHHTLGADMPVIN